MLLSEIKPAASKAAAKLARKFYLKRELFLRKQL